MWMCLCICVYIHRYICVYMYIYVCIQTHGYKCACILKKRKLWLKVPTCSERGFWMCHKPSHSHKLSQCLKRC